MSLCASLVVAALALAACRGAPLDDGPGGARRAEGDPDGGAGSGATPAEPLPEAPWAEKDVEPGAYARDPRFRALAADWAARVDRAVDRLAVVTGLAFEAEARPRVVLTPLGDERVPYEMRAKVVEGRRSVILRMNAEPLVAGVLDPDRTLLRALGAAAFEDAARRHGSVARWVVHMGGTAAAGDLERQLEGLWRRAAEGDRRALEVDPTNAAAAQATALAALLLLAERGEPGSVRRLLSFAADGDDANELMARLAKEPGNAWAGRAREILSARLDRLDASPWRLLQRARAAAAESGRAGLDAMLGDAVPPEIAEEIAVLRARAAADEGDFEGARRLLRALPPDAPSALADPAAAVALRVKVETRTGGDAALARRLAGELDRDFPRSDARRELREEHPMLGMEEDPQRWMAAMRARIERDGTGSLALRTVGRYARTLLQDHRAGAAQRFLDGLGPRRHAPELAGVVAAVEEAQRVPSDAAQQRNAARVAAWSIEPGEERAREVRDGGRAAAPALLALLRTTRGSERAPILQLLVQATGAGAAVAVLQEEWARDPRAMPRDLERLATVVPYARLRAATDDRRLAQLGISDVEALWEQVRLGLDPAWLAKRPGFLQAVRHEEYGIRRGAFERLLAEGGAGASPGLVAHGLGDKAALMRRIALRLAGMAGFPAVARRGLEDPAWLVREEAVQVVAKLEGAGAVALLVQRLQQDEAVRVRVAAAAALLRVAPSEPRALRALLRTQVEEDLRLRDGVATGLTRVDPLPVARVIAEAWGRAVVRRRPHRGFLARTALLFQRIAKVDLAFTPDATRAELRRMLGAMRAWIAREEASPGGSIARALRTLDGAPR